MFTGIIEEVGKVEAIKRGSQSTSLVIAGIIIFSDLSLGDSVAVNGVCLTVARLTKMSFEADVMNETLARSSLGTLTQGSRVNLERAMPLNGRFGGHIVSGHIDGTGTITSIERDSNAVWFEIATTPHIMRYIVDKGSIALDGASLTVASVQQDCFKVSIIPHTIENTMMRELKVGSVVNLENDVLGKYVEKLLGVESGTSEPRGGFSLTHSTVSESNRSDSLSQKADTSSQGITFEFLTEHGF